MATKESTKRDPTDLNAHTMRLGHETTREAFNDPQLSEEYERFLSLLVISGLKDRLRAMEIRKRDGVESALAFLDDYTLTPEHLQSAPVTRDEAEDEPAQTTNRRDEALVVLESILTTIPLLANSYDETQMRGGFSLIEHAVKRVDQLVAGIVLPGEGAGP
jgi:hypothetical protein